MKKIKFNYLAIIAMVVAMGTVAFTATSDKKTLLASEVWFEVDVSGAINPAAPEASEQIITSMLSGTPTSPCDSPAGPLCAVKIDVSNIDLQSYDFESGEHTVAELNNDDAPSIEVARKL